MLIQSRRDGERELHLKRVAIIGLAFLIWAGLSKIQGNGFVERHLFPFSDLTMIWPYYLSVLAIHLGFVCYAWTLYSQETVLANLEKTSSFWDMARPQEVKLAAVLVSGRLVDFVLECNHGWFGIGDYPISYDTFAFVLFGLVSLKTILWKEKDGR